MRVLLLDIGLGNLRSVEKALLFVGRERKVALEVVRSSDPALLGTADAIVFPGQGGFRDCMRALGAGAAEALLDRLGAGIPYLGICLGLQVLFERSEEAPDERGLGLFSGKVERLRGGDGVKIPHMGFNQLELEHGGHPCLAAAGGEGAWMYFVHSYHAVPDDPTLIVSSSRHGQNKVTAAVFRDNVLGVQFHPEKSQGPGLALLGEFLARAR